MENRNPKYNNQYSDNTEKFTLDKFIDEHLEICRKIDSVTLSLCQCINDEEYDQADDLIKQREYLLSSAVSLKEKIYYFTISIQDKKKLNSIMAPVFEDLKNSNQRLSSALASKKNKVSELIQKAIMQKAIAMYK